jgi:hypothetical protein
LQAIDKCLLAKRNPGSSLDMLETLKGFDLIKYYHKHPKFSFEDLLQYNNYAIRDFIVSDKKFKLHNWLSKHNLLMPTDLIRDGWSKISDLCSNSGIEYLNRKVLVLPLAEQQNKLNEIAHIDSCQLGRDKKIVLNDVLVGEHEVSWNTIDSRFNAFKKREQEKEAVMVEKFTDKGVHSLFWYSAKKVAKASLPCDELSLVCKAAVEAAGTLKLL